MALCWVQQISIVLIVVVVVVVVVVVISAVHWLFAAIATRQRRTMALLGLASALQNSL